MKQKMIMFGIVLLLTLAFVAPSYAKPTTFTVNFNQAQFQWRASAGPIGAWTYSYLNSPQSSDYLPTGNVLHTSWSYSPLVTDLTGQSTVYTYNKASGLWIEHEGQVTYMYVAGYGPYQIANFFRGYVQFDGTPSPDNFVHGVAYQWVYLYAPENAVLPSPLDVNAVWDSTIDAWLVGFSIYLWDPTSFTQSYTTAFPSPFIEPVPASNYNPLGL